MGYIKKLKNNELVGGTDKTTIYPVTSTEAVFEEVSDNEFKSQQYLNNHITNERIVDNTIENRKLKDDTIDMGKLNTQLKTTIQNAYDASWKVKEEPFSLETKYDANDVVYDPNTNSSYVSLTADNQGNPVKLEDEEEVNPYWRLVINGISAIQATEEIEATKDELIDYIQENLKDQVDDEIADAESRVAAAEQYAQGVIAEAEQTARSISGIVYQTVAATPNYTDTIPVQNKAVTAQIGYYTCSGGSGATIIVDDTDAAAFTPVKGGHIKILMTQRSAVTSGNVQLQFGSVTATKKVLLYNEEAVSSSNTWELGEVISVYYDGTKYHASNAQGGSNKKIDAYLYGDLRTLGVGQAYEENEAVKTTDKQLLRVTKEVRTMNVTDTVATGDLKVFGGNTYQAQEAIGLYNGTETEGLYAIGRPAGADIAVTVDDEAIALLEDTELITVSVAGIDLTVPVTSESTDLTIAANIAELFGTQPEWTLTDNLDGTLTLKSKVGKAAAPTVTSDTGDTGVSISIVPDSSYAGSVVLSKYVEGAWSNVSLANYLADNTIWTTLTLEDLLAYTIQNTVDKDIDAATVISGEEFFKLSDYIVKSSNKTNSTPSKTSTYIQSTIGVANKGTNLVVGPINGLVAGEEYIMEFDYIQTMTVPRDVVIVFCTGTVNNSDNFNISSSSPRTGLFNDSNGHISIRFIYPTTAHKYIRFEYVTGAVGKYLRISNISIHKSNKTAIEAISKAFEAYDVSKSNYDAIHDVQQSTERTDGWLWFGGSSSSGTIGTRLRILYKCNPHCRVTLSYSASTVYGTCNLMSNYNISDGLITNDNTLKNFWISSGNTYTKEWDNKLAKYILLNLYNVGDTTKNLTTAQVNAVRNSLNVVIEDVEGYDGLDKRVTDLENKEESESAVNINMIFGTNVKDCGAKGDGISDDTNALQTALNKRGTIYIPNGTYLITNSLAMYSNTHIIMDKGTVIKRNVDARFCILYSYYTASTTAYNGEHDITIEGGTLDLGTGYSLGGCGLGFQHCQNITIRDVTIKHVTAGYHCIDCGGSKNVRIENCIFTDHSTNALSAEMVQIDRTAYGSFPIPASYPSEGSACYDNTGCENVEICGCKFYVNKWSPAIGNHSQIAVHQHIDIHDNFIFGIGSSAQEGYRGAIAFANANNNINYVYIHDNIIKNFVRGFQFIADKLFWVKNNVFIDVVTKQGDGDHGVFIDNIEITTS